MIKLRKGSPAKEYWEAEDLANFKNINLMAAKKHFEDYHKEYGGGYGPIEKALILDYVERKQLEQREREARHQSDLSNIERTAVLKEQVKTMKEQVKALNEQVKTLNEMSLSSDRRARIANLIAWLSLIISFITLLLKLQ